MRVCVAVVCALSMSAQSRHVTDEEVRRVHESAILIDTHNDAPSRTVKGIDFGTRSSIGHTDIPRLRQGGVAATFFAAYVGADYAVGNRSAHRALQMIDSVRNDIVAKHAKEMVLATSADEVLAAHKQGKIAAIIGIEGGHAIEDSLGLLRDYFALGVRYMTLTHTNTNSWADSSGDMSKKAVAHHNGLTDFGKQVIREMNRLGMMVDVSHVADKTFWDVIETSKAPPIASHSSCRALTNVPRNMTDEMIIALAKKGGVIQINFFCGFVSQRYADAIRPHMDAFDAQLDALNEKYRSNPAAGEIEIQKAWDAFSADVPPATIDDVVAHIDHVVKIAGIDAVGIGSDFDGISCAPKGLDDVSQFPNLTRALMEKGYTADQIHKIYGGNLLRVMRAVDRK